MSSVPHQSTSSHIRFPGCAIAAAELGVSRQHLYSVLAGKRKSNSLLARWNAWKIRNPNFDKSHSCSDIPSPTNTPADLEAAFRRVMPAAQVKAPAISELASAITARGYEMADEVKADRPTAYALGWVEQALVEALTFISQSEDARAARYLAQLARVNLPA